VTHRFTLSTETRPNLAALAAAHFDAFTLRAGTGYWNGQPEPSTDIIVVGDLAVLPEVEALAARINEENDQQAVLLQVEPIVGRIVTSRPAAVAVAA
jgi:hypothetical protein